MNTSPYLHKQLHPLEWLQQSRNSRPWKLRQILVEGVRTGNKIAVSSAIKNGAEVQMLLITDMSIFGINYAENDLPYTLLGLAAEHGHQNLIDPLLKAGIDINDRGGSNRPPLNLAIEENHVEFARKLIKLGADLEAKTTNNNGFAFTSLHLAVNFNHLECMKLLLQENANVDAVDRCKYTPLHRAAMFNNLSAIQLLLDGGCNRKALTIEGKTALHVAATKGKGETVELLIIEGFDPHSKDSDGYTPMYNAEDSGYASLSSRLAKLTQRDINCHNDFSNNGSLPIFEQLKSNSSLRGYYERGDEALDLVEYNFDNPGSWRALKLHMPMSRSGYYQNKEGLTILHIAAKNGNLEAVKMFVEELDIYPHLKAYDGNEAADLAKTEGHHGISNYLKTSFKVMPLTLKSEIDLYDNLLEVICTSDNVSEASQLLSRGAPLESYGRTRPSAIALAILWNRLMILELLLAAGASLTVNHHGKTLLEVAWLSPYVTMMVKQMICRAYYNTVDQEMYRNINSIDTHKKSYFEFGIPAYVTALKGNTPWKARWEIKKEQVNILKLRELRLGFHPISKDLIGLSSLMGTAAKHNCRIAAFLLHQVGGRPNIRNNLGSTPLHEALNEKLFDLASVMVKHLGASLYITDCNGRLPKDLMPTHMKQKLEQEQAAGEFSKLDKSVQSARSESEKAELKEIALVFVCLFATYTKQWDHKLCKWQDLHNFLVSLIQNKVNLDKLSIHSDSDISEGSTNEHYIWVKLLCQDINKLNNRDNFNCEETDIGLIDLLSCIDDFCSKRRIQENMLTLIISDQKCKSSNLSTSNLLLKSVKYATENRYTTFLHLLFTIGKQSIDTPLDDMIQSHPLHHAAAAGNLSAMLYLTLTLGAAVDELDRNQNTPAHLAYMNGFMYIGDYLCNYNQNVQLIRNYSEQTPLELRNAFSAYEKLYDIVEEKDRYDVSLNLTEQIDGLSLTTILLEHWFTKSKSLSFREIMENSIVDFNNEEANLVKSLMVEFAKRIGSKIATYNSLLKGTLFLVGSAGDNVRLNAPDEYDCTWVLDCTNVRVILEEMSIEDQTLNKYKHIIRAESDDSDIQSLLTGTNLLEEFFKQCVKSVRDLVPHLDPRLSLILPGVKRIGCGACITLAWADSTYPMLLVSMDLVPAIKASRPANFPHPPLTRNIEDPRLDSIYVVQTHIHAGENRCATTLEEQIVMQQLSSGQHLVFIIAKLLVSKLKTEKWASRIFKDRFTFFSTKEFKLPAPTGFLLKSALFKELERITNPELWEESFIFDRLKDIFHSMCETRDDNSLVSGLVPSYFSSTTQPPAAGFMAPAIYGFLVGNEETLRRMEDSTSNGELERLSILWDEALNKYYYIPKV